MDAADFCMKRLPKTACNTVSLLNSRKLILIMFSPAIILPYFLGFSIVSHLGHYHFVGTLFFCCSGARNPVKQINSNESRIAELISSSVVFCQIIIWFMFFYESSYIF
ncbi:MAG: hypothetical protein DRP47_03690 [Candidatus Zixiibacteriota bacterium]|nr:MAG: hypothetical protein DRP47_03690 [candidate division Zixibacteria bacterium]